MCRLVIKEEEMTMTEEEIATPDNAHIERVEADREHLRKQHGFFISKNCPPNVLSFLHAKDHGKEQKTEFYKPHEHQSLEVDGNEELVELTLE